MKRSALQRTKPMARGTSQLRTKTPMSRGSSFKTPVAGASLLRVAAVQAKLRTRKCAVKTCRKPFAPRSMTHKACSPECSELYVAAEKARKQARELREGRAKLKRKGDYLSEAQAAFNAYIRFRDRDQPCICCGQADARSAGGLGGGWDAGHWISRGHASHLRFNEANVHKQRKGCNRPGGTTRAKYRVGLVARIGEDAVRELESLEYTPTEKRWTVDELRAVKALYVAKLKALKDAA